MLAHFLLQLQQRGELLFGQHPYLQIEMSALFRLAGHAVLADQNENGQEDGFGRHHNRQNAKRKGVKWFHTSDQAQIYRHPNEKEREMQRQKHEAAGRSGNGIAGTLREGTATESVLFQFRDGRDIELGGMNFRTGS